MSNSHTRLLQTLFQLEPKKPTIAKGLRAAVATVLPIAIVGFTGQADLVWIALGGFETSIADIGGLYRTRATAMSVMAVGSVVSMLVATLAGGTPWLAVSLMFLWAFGSGLASMYGNAISTASNLIAAMFLIALGIPGDFASALQRAGLFLIGALFAMFLALVLWPLQPYQPVRIAVGECYWQLSKFMRASSYQPATEIASENAWDIVVRQKRVLVREALATARAAISETRATRLGATPLGQRLLVLTEIADRLFVSTVALAEVLEGHHLGSAWEQVRTHIQHTVEQLSENCHSLATTISNRRSTTVNLWELDRAIDILQKELKELRATSRQELDYSALLVVSYTVGILDRAAKSMHAAADAVECCREGRRDLNSENNASIVSNQTLGKLQVLRDNLNLDSAVFRHALRLGVTAAVAVAIYSIFHLKEGSWITLTVIVILKPYSGVTFQRGLQRVCGTFLGGIVAAILAAAVHSPLLMAFLLFPLTVATLSLQPINYGLFAFFLTPQVILMDTILHSGNWHLAVERILNTAIGGVLALIGGYLLWPSREYQRLPAQLATTIAANCVYFQAVLAKYLGRADGESIQSALQRVRLENTNAEASFQRLLSEPHKQKGDLEPAIALLTYIQQFSDAVTALAAHLSAWSGHHQLPGLDRFARQVEAAMTDFAAAVRSGSPPALLGLEETQKEIAAHLQELHAARVAELVANQGHTPTREAVLDYTFVSIEVERISSILTMMHSAIYRMSGVEQTALLR